MQSPWDSHGQRSRIAGRHTGGGGILKAGKHSQLAMATIASQANLPADETGCRDARMAATLPDF
jgi:hypothetical protein